MRITWTEHALDRAFERLSPERRVAVEEIRRAGAAYRVGESFRLSVDGVVYVCRRQGKGVTVLTVYPVRFIGATE